MIMTKAFRIHHHGGPEVLTWEDAELSAPGLGEVLIRHTAIGLNFSDVYLRTGLYSHPLPSGVGGEAAGVIEAVGRKVKGFRAGDHVVYMFPVPGAYCEKRVMPAAALLKIPKGVSNEQAAAVLLKGLTAWYLLRETFKVERGDTILIQAASGGVGLIASQWARALGAKVIGVVGSAEKVALAKKHGCHHVLVGFEDLGNRVKRLNKGVGADVVYDGTGMDTILASLDSLKPRGVMVSFGNSSGPVAPIAPLELAKRGSLYLTRPAGADYLADAAARQRGVRELFRLMKNKKIKVHIGQRYPLVEAPRAQADLEARRTVGSTVLIP
jgi:NADPH2:quinone reductase